MLTLIYMIMPFSAGVAARGSSSARGETNRSWHLRTPYPWLSTPTCARDAPCVTCSTVCSTDVLERLLFWDSTAGGPPTFFFFFFRFPRWEVSSSVAIELRRDPPICRAHRRRGMLRGLR